MGREANGLSLVSANINKMNEYLQILTQKGFKIIKIKTA
jgi:hypothetical protein